MLSPNGIVTVSSVAESAPTETLVWELTVDTNHNFTVFTGTADVLVHNCGPGNDFFTGNPDRRPSGNTYDADADALAQELGGDAQVEFLRNNNDYEWVEMDVVTDEIVGEVKSAPRLNEDFESKRLNDSDLLRQRVEPSTAGSSDPRTRPDSGTINPCTSFSSGSTFLCLPPQRSCDRMDHSEQCANEIQAQLRQLRISPLNSHESVRGDVIALNGIETLIAFGAKNHDSGTSKKLVDLLARIAEIAAPSEGMLWTADEASGNWYVHTLKNGKIEAQEDPWFSTPGWLSDGDRS